MAGRPSNKRPGPPHAEIVDLTLDSDDDDVQADHNFGSWVSAQRSAADAVWTTAGAPASPRPAVSRAAVSRARQDVYVLADCAV